MALLLSSIDGQPYESWHMFHLPITPNSLLSGLAALSRSSVLLMIAECLGQLKWNYYQQRSRRLFDLQLFDEASRGPFGAFRLLWNVNVRAYAASAGALFTMLALVLEPFTQQILSFPPGFVDMKNGSTTVNTVRLVRPSPGEDVTDYYGSSTCTFAICAELNSETEHRS